MENNRVNGGFATVRNTNDTTHIPPHERPYQDEKYLALYKARKVLTLLGKMEERRICGSQLKKMQGPAKPKKRRKKKKKKK